MELIIKPKGKAIQVQIGEETCTTSIFTYFAEEVETYVDGEKVNIEVEQGGIIHELGEEFVGDNIWVDIEEFKLDDDELTFEINDIADIKLLKSCGEYDDVESMIMVSIINKDGYYVVSQNQEFLP